MVFYYTWSKNQQISIMKKSFLLLLAVFFSLSICGQEIPVNLNEDPPAEPGSPHRSSALLLSVTFDDNEVYVYAPCYIESMEVVIYDATGEVIYSYTSAMILGKNTIILPPMVSESKFCIVLNFNEHSLIGYF